MENLQLQRKEGWLMDSFTLWHKRFPLRHPSPKETWFTLQAALMQWWCYIHADYMPNTEEDHAAYPMLYFGGTSAVLYIYVTDSYAI